MAAVAKSMTNGWKIYQWLLTGIVLLTSCTTPVQHTKNSRPMNLDQAILLTKAWCSKAHESFSTAKVAANGDFRGQFGAAEIVYFAQTGTLSVEGLVLRDATALLELNDVFEDFRRAGDREPSTMGEGHFYIERTPTAGPPAQLTLRKDFQDGSLQTNQFVKEVDWLMEWSTHWRLQRSLIVINKPEAQLIEEAPTIEAWARKNRPRPW